MRYRLPLTAAHGFTETSNHDMNVPAGFCVRQIFKVQVSPSYGGKVECPKETHEGVDKQSTVERFQRETGISTRFKSELDEVKMPQGVCRELALIVQEGLVNVRSHRGTQHVQVRLTDTDSHWRVTIEDDGRSFPSSGRFLVIRERVRLIEGELTESSTSRASRLVVTVPKRVDSTIGNRT